ncbi:hypothetical protein WICPIJ_000772 [Wickerhamomyces pijperi]|uniref:Uncharacterized protein n=1 Tax=Wickerhamomyces pijperi TaxID=599730 RepID=A0A9P8QC02_WICPI|nr:hypothetical protein WICPIJ_000772 [Wickerhamomyces pijperi]
MDLIDINLVLTTTTFELVMFQLSNNRHQPTDPTNMDSEGIRGFHQSFLHERSSTMGNHTITFHFTETQPTITRSTLDRLSCQDLHRTTGTSMDLVVHHVS